MARKGGLSSDRPVPAWTFLRGYGTTRFLSSETFRNGQQSAVALDVIARWSFDDATYDRTAASFDNPDHVAIVIHNYRWRLSLAKGEPRYDDLERKVFARPVITVPTITASDFDGTGADGSAYAKMYTGSHSHRILKGIGHNVPQEAPEAFARTVLDVDRH